MPPATSSIKFFSDNPTGQTKSLKEKTSATDDPIRIKISKFSGGMIFADD
jgi:hypothetical protein